jgi:hypothetical protein
MPTPFFPQARCDLCHPRFTDTCRLTKEKPALTACRNKKGARRLFPLGRLSTRASYSPLCAAVNPLLRPTPCVYSPRCRTIVERIIDLPRPWSRKNAHHPLRQSPLGQMTSTETARATWKYRQPGHRDQGLQRTARAVASVPLLVATVRSSSGLSRTRLLQPPLQVVANAQGVSHNGQAGFTAPLDGKKLASTT